MTAYGRSAGACAICAAREARVIRRGWSGSAVAAGQGVPKPAKRARSSHSSYSLLSFHVAAMPLSSSDVVTCPRHHAAAAGLVKSM